MDMLDPIGVQSKQEVIDEVEVQTEEVEVPEETVHVEYETHYAYRTDGEDGEPVTFRVVHVDANSVELDSDGESESKAVGTGTLRTHPQPVITAATSSIIANGRSDGSSSSPPSTETRFTYFPTIAADAGDSGVTQTAIASTPSGQFYVMMSSSDLMNTAQRAIAPRPSFTSKVDGTRTVRDERRRATHNEVERRRRDKINTWILKLGKIIPDCDQDHTKQGQSKGGILSKACDYIQELRASNEHLIESAKVSDQLQLELQILKQQCEELKNENSILKNRLIRHGLSDTVNS